MTGFSGLRSRLTTPDGTDYTAGAEAFNRQRTANSRPMRP
jgi:hypothetical protein